MKDLPRTPEGEPMVVYHSGTFDETIDPTPEVGVEGMHFGTKAAAEQRIVGKSVDDMIRGARYTEEAYEAGNLRWWWRTDDGLDSFDFDSRGFNSAEEAKRDLQDRAVSFAEFDDMEWADDVPITEVYLNIKNPKRTADHGADWAEAVAQAKAEGHDSIVYRNRYEDKGKDSYVIFHPTQAKSVKNIGTYDPTDPSILRSMRPETGAAPATTPTAKDLEAGRKEALAYIDHPGFERRMVSRLKEMGMSKDDATAAFARARARVESTTASVADPKELPGAAVATYTPEVGSFVVKPAKIRVSRESTEPAYDSFHEFMHAAQDDELLIDFMNEVDAFDLVTTPMGKRPYFATDPPMGVARAFGELLVDAVGAIPKQRKRVGSIHRISTEQADKIASSVLEEMERIPGAPKLTDFEKTLRELRTRPDLQYIGSPDEAHVAMIQMRRDMLSEGFIKDQYEVIDERKMGEYLSRSYESLPSEVKTLRPYLTSKNLTTFTRAFNRVPAVVAAWSATKQSKEKPRQR